MGVMAALAMVVVWVTLFRNQVLPVSPPSFTLAEVTSTPAVTGFASVPKARELVLADFKYPGTEIVSLGNNRLVLKSADGPEAITSWYQEKLQAVDLNIRNFVQTKTNDQVKNQLSGVRGKEKINVSIEKEDVSSPVKIIVSLTYE